MLFPIGDDQVRGGYYPYVTYGLILLNTGFFLYEMVLPPEKISDLLFTYGLIPQHIISGESWYTLFSSLFFHAGWVHFLGNLLFLWVFADNIEASVGSFRFFLFYLAGGVVASLVHILVNPASGIPTIGASGAISAVMGAYLILFPGSQIKVILVFFFFTFRVPAILFLGFWIGQQFLSGMVYLTSSMPESGGGGVAWWAHIGGIVFGLSLGWFFRRHLELRGTLEQDST